MSDLVNTAFQYARALCKDALGNGSCGNTERSLRYVAEVVRVLDAAAALQAVIDDDSKRAQAEQNLIDVLRSAGDKPDWPKFEMNEKVFKKYCNAAWLNDL